MSSLSLALFKVYTQSTHEIAVFPNFRMVTVYGVRAIAEGRNELGC